MRTGTWLLLSFAIVLSFLVGLQIDSLQKSRDLISAPPQPIVKNAQAQAQTPTPPQAQFAELQKLNQAFVSLAEAMSPTVVNIYTSTRLDGSEVPDELFDFFFGNPFQDRLPPGHPQIPPQEAQALGSGFVINNEGYIVTNTHVIQPTGTRPDSVSVQFIGEGLGKGYEAEVVGVDGLTDVGLLKLKSPKPDLKVARLGDSDAAQVGEWVIAIGNPYGHAHTVTQGIVSAIGRNIESVGAEFIQTSASINPGNSGGPLINMSGEVIGINTAIDPRAQGIGFAIPVNIAKEVIPQLINKGEVPRGWIGISIGALTPEVAKSQNLDGSEGVVVREVVQGSPAAQAGLRANDIILEVNDESVVSPEALAYLIGRLPVGRTARIEVVRNGKRRTLNVTVTRQES